MPNTWHMSTAKESTSRTLKLVRLKLFPSRRKLRRAVWTGTLWVLPGSRTVRDSWSTRTRRARARMLGHRGRPAFGFSPDWAKRHVSFAITLMDGLFLPKGRRLLLGPTLASLAAIVNYG